MTVTKVPFQDTTAMGVYLEFGSAPVGGAVFTLGIKSGQPNSVTFPPTVTVPEGETGVQFAVTWASAGSTILQAQLTEIGGSPPDPVGEVYEVDVEALAGDVAAITELVPATATVQEGQTLQMAVVLSREVVGNKDVTLVSSDPTVATVPGIVTVLDGNHSVVFNLTALKGGATTVTATYLAVPKQSAVTVEAVEIQPLAPDDFEILVDEIYTMVVFFEAPVVRNETVTLESDDTNIVTVLSSVVVSSGQQSAEFDVTAVRLGTATITATHTTGVKTSDLSVVAKGFGPSAYVEGPTGIAAVELVPIGISAERID